MNFKGTKTEQNMLQAFLGESQARNKYSYYAEQARIEGKEETAEIFDRMADNERTHAKIWYKFLNDGIMGTEAGLKDAIASEHYEWTEMYKTFAEEARSEGLGQIAMMFDKIADIESMHEKQFVQELSRLQGILQAEQKPLAKWVCRFCGATSDEENPAYACPVCGALGSYDRHK